jgi:chromate transport protein ChrA
VSIGLMCAGILSLARLAIFNVTTFLFMAAVFAFLLWRHINPAFLILAGGVAGWLFLHR